MLVPAIINYHLVFNRAMNNPEPENKPLREQNGRLIARVAILVDHIHTLHAAIRALGDYEGSDDEMFNDLHEAVHQTNINKLPKGI